MAARRGVVLTEEHRDLIAAGELSLNELAGQLGVTRQTLYVNFKRRGWPTTPAADAVDDDSPAQPQRAPGSRPRQRPASARSASPASFQPPAPVASPGAPGAPTMVEISSAEELTEHARRAIAAVALAALDRAHEILTKPLGASALKAAVAATVLAADQLRRAGFDVASVADQVAPRMIIQEMTAAEVAATQASVEAEYQRAVGADEDLENAAMLTAEDVAEQMDEAAPRQRAA